ncbi:hypothetical protein HK096_007563, partial [Nowakowskiella sp. JEL0078]
MQKSNLSKITHSRTLRISKKNPKKLKHLNWDSEKLNSDPFRSFYDKLATDIRRKTAPFRKVVMRSIKEVMRSYDKAFTVETAGSFKNGTDLDSDFDIVVKTSNPISKRIHKELYNLIIKCIEKNILKPVVLKECGHSIRADSFCLLGTNQETLFKVDLVFATTTFKPTPYSTLRVKWLPHQQMVVQALKMFFRRKGQPKRKGIYLEMLTLYANHKLTKTTEASELFLALIKDLDSLLPFTRTTADKLKRAVNEALLEMRIHPPTEFQAFSVKNMLENARMFLKKLKRLNNYRNSYQEQTIEDIE